MQKKYNIALLPIKLNQQIIDYAKHFSKIVDCYQLGRNSFPHVTLYQFFSDQNDIAILWKKLISTLKISTIQLTFNTVSCTSSDEKLFWISLLPVSQQKKTLLTMHEVVASVLNLPTKLSFDPHITLINTRNKNCKMFANNFANYFTEITDQFILSLGDCDKVGQFTKPLFKIF